MKLLYRENKHHMNITKLALLVFTLAVISCNRNEAQKEMEKAEAIAVRGSKTPLDYDLPKVYALLDKAIYSGDTNAYNEVAGYYMLAFRHTDFLYYSLIMANKYNYKSAYFHVYIGLSRSWADARFGKNDNRTENMALFYLLKSYEMGFRSAEFEVDEVFKGKQIPKSSFYLKEMAKQI